MLKNTLYHSAMNRRVRPAAKLWWDEPSMCDSQTTLEGHMQGYLEHTATEKWRKTKQKVRENEKGAKLSLYIKVIILKIG